LTDLKTKIKVIILFTFDSANIKITLIVILKYTGLREGVIELENQLSICKNRLAETTDYLKEEHHASLILANFYKDLDSLLDCDE